MTFLKLFILQLFHFYTSTDTKTPVKTQLCTNVMMLTGQNYLFSSQRTVQPLDSTLHWPRDTPWDGNTCNSECAQRNLQHTTPSCIQFTHLYYIFLLIIFKQIKMHKCLLRAFILP